MKKSIKFILIILLVLSVLSGIFIIWANGAAQPMPEALAALQPDQAINVTVGDWLVFEPVGGEATVGYIFYPGGKVDYRAYAPYAKAIAEQGFLVIIPKMPLNLAVFSPNVAADVIKAYPGVNHWAVGGHSLGGSMAANFVYSHPDFRGALIFLGSYPAASNDLSNRKDLIVYSISGSKDGLSTPEKIMKSRALLPVSSVFIEIEGGNHAQFGWYGFQSGDQVATITRESQQELIIKATLEALKSLENLGK